MKSLTSFFLLTTSLMFNPYALYASSNYTTQTPASISLSDLWTQGVKEGNLKKIEKSLKNGFKPTQDQVTSAYKILMQNNKKVVATWLTSGPYGIAKPSINSRNEEITSTVNTSFMPSSINAPSQIYENATPTISSKELWQQGHQSGNLSQLKNSLALGYRPENEEINILFYEKAAEGKIDVLNWMLTVGLKPDSFAIGQAFKLASQNGHQDMMVWLLTQPSDISLPDSHSIRDSFILAAANGFLEIMKFLNTNSYCKEKLTNFSVTKAMATAGRNGQVHVLQWILEKRPINLYEVLTGMLDRPILNNETKNSIDYLLSLPQAKQSLSQQQINQIGAALFNFDKNYFSSVLENFVFFRPDPQTIKTSASQYFYTYYVDQDRVMNLLQWYQAHSQYGFSVTQGDIDFYFIQAATNTQSRLVRFIFDDENQFPTPNINVIIDEYRNLSARTDLSQDGEHILQFLTPLVPLEERINQWRAPGQMNPNYGRAFEIHNFAETLVPDSCNSGRTSPSESQKLFDAILGAIDTRIQRVKLVEIYMIHPRLIAAIEHQYKEQPEKITLAKQALQNGFEYENAKLYLQKVLTFLDTCFPAAFDLWFNGFIDESITAYQNSQHQLSCTKGIEERILTGLRGVDEKLDQIFKHAEAPLLMKKFVENNLNLGLDENIPKITNILKDFGVLPSTPVSEAKKVFSDYINRALGEYNAPIPEKVQEYVSYAIQTFEDIYDQTVKPLLEVSTIPQNSTIPLNDRKMPS